MSILSSPAKARGETARKSALKWLIVFIAVMAALTLANNALTELSVAVVSKTTPQRGSLERSVSGEGTLEAGGEAAVWQSSLYRISDIFVSVGDEVSQGDPLFSFDMIQISEQLADAENSLKKLENNRDMSLIDTSNSAADTSVSDALEKYNRQKEDFQQTVDTQDRKVGEAWQAINDAIAARDSAKDAFADALANSYDSAVSSARESLEKASQSLINAQYSYEAAILSAQQSENNARTKLDEAIAGGDDAAIKAAELSLEIALVNNAANLEKSAQSLNNAQSEYYKAQDAANNIDVSSQIESKRTALENAETNITTKTTAWETAVRDRESALKTAQRSLDDDKSSYDKAKAQAAASSANAKANEEKSAISLENTEMEIEAQRKKVEALRKLSESEGVVRAETAGVITANNLTRYQTPGSSSPLMIISDSAQGLTLKIQISSDDAEYMEAGDSVTLTFADGGMGRFAVSAINDVSGNADRKEIVVYVQGGSGKAGEKAKLRFTERSDSYSALIPLEALRQDSTGYYVYTIRQSEDSLGARTTVERIDVILLDRDSSRAAVSGAVGMSDSLVVRSDRSLSDGDRVRVEE